MFSRSKRTAGPLTFAALTQCFTLELFIVHVQNDHFCIYNWFSLWNYEFGIVYHFHGFSVIEKA